MTDPVPPVTLTPMAKQTCVPALTPCTSKFGSCLTTSDVDMDSGDRSLLMLNFLPKGHQLVIHGYVSANPIETPVAMIKDLLTAICQDPRFEYFTKVPIIVSPFSNRLSNASSACYVKLKYNKSEAGLKPRIDLLKEIWVAIAEFKLE